MVTVSAEHDGTEAVGSKGTDGRMMGGGGKEGACIKGGLHPWHETPRSGSGYREKSWSD